MLISKLNKIYQKSILPRLYFIPYYIHFIFIKIFFLLKLKKYNNNLKVESNLVISAGIKGWESIEFKELLYSAREYLGNDKVFQHILLENDNYLYEAKTIIKQNKITHFFYDPRTGNQGVIKGTIEAMRLSFILTKYNVIPIVYLTDMSFRRWRIKGAIISAISGIAILFVTPRLAWPIFPHRRLYGPSLMPFSIKTLNEIQKDIKRDFSVNEKLSAYFIGSLYEPRTTILNNIKNGLINLGFDLIISGRQLGTKRRTDSEYWKTIIDAPIIITTSDQLESDDFDWSWIPNLVYRYLEAIASGALLVAPIVPCVDRYFEPGIHFVSFNSEEEAINKIEYYLTHNIERENIAKAGMIKARALIESKVFWLHIDTCLSYNSLL